MRLFEISAQLYQAISNSVVEVQWCISAHLSSTFIGLRNSAEHDPEKMTLGKICSTDRCGEQNIFGETADK